MSIVSDIATDYQHIEGVENVTFTPRNPDAASINNVKALRRELSKSAQYLGASAGIEPTDVPWHLWATTLGAVVPKNGDTVTDSAGIVWRIKSLTFSPRTSRYRCLCRQDAA